MKPKNLKKGIVMSIFGENILVFSNNKEYLLPIRGSLKNKKTSQKNILAAGDIIYFSSDAIEKIEKRRSILSRESLITKKEQIIASNIDKVIITSSVLAPKLKPTLIDRYIISTIKGNLEPIVVINKIDLLEDPSFSDSKKEKEKKLLKELVLAYKKANIKTILTSTKTKKGLLSLKKELKNSSVVFSGQSGTGKSSLINVLTKKNLKTGLIVKKTLKGAHITTKATLIPLENNSFCIDTPGIKSFTIWDIKKEDIKNYFFEFLQFAKNCKFRNCSHIKEINCSVKKAVKEKKISPLRYSSFLSLLKDTDKKR